MPTITELVAYCDGVLAAGEYNDYCPNGLQVAGRQQVKRVVGGVTACQALVDAAIELGADALLVHHGYFWKGEDARIVGMKQARLKKLLQHDINLIAYHLPLDAHPQYGNNAGLAAALGLETSGVMSAATPWVFHGHLMQAMSGADLALRIGQALNRTPLHIDGGGHKIQTVGWCSGGAQGHIEQAAALGLDAYISGEISEQTVHTARELGIHYFAAGHHATERFGVQRLGAHLREKFALDFQFVDIDNPV